MKLKPVIRLKAVKHCLAAAFILIAGGALFLPTALQAAPDKVIAFAAASTTNALNDIAAAFTAETRIEVICSFASSSTLAKQIENGAPADLFISADVPWMDYLVERRLIASQSLINLLSNRIVLIVPTKSDLSATTITADSPLGSWLADGRLAIGDPTHVPAGIYGRQSLESLGLWAQVQERLAPAKDVRAALTLVERAECPMGLVYATDATISDKVRVIAALPAASHPPIIYPAALVAGHTTPAAQRLLEYLHSDEGRGIFAKYGFTAK